MQSQSLIMTILAGVASMSALAGPVNINTADASTLAAELVGVGPALARAIVEDRTRNGAYSAPEDLLRVSGIGPRILENNRDDIRVVTGERTN